MATCRHCGKAILNREEFISELSDKHGIEVDPDNIDRFRICGASSGLNAFAIAVGNVQATYDTVQKKRAFQCRNCGASWCLECLAEHGNADDNGDSVCRFCSGAFVEL